MFFFKPKQQDEVILPPPPPIPDIEGEPDALNGLDIRELSIEELGRNLDFTAKSLAKEGKRQPKKPKEISEAESEIESAIERMKKEEKTSFFRKFFPIRQKINGAIKDMQASWAFGTQKTYPKKSPIEQLNSLNKSEEVKAEQIKADGNLIIQNIIKKVRDSLMKLDLKSAKEDYLEIMGIYNSMKPEEQVKVYHDIKDLYAERKSAEELKI